MSRRSACIIIGTALGLAAILLPSQAGAQSVNPASGLAPAGYLTLGFSGSDGAFKQYAAGATNLDTATPVSTQTLGLSGCQVTNVGGSLAAVTATGSRPSEVGETSGSANSFVGLGVKQKNGSGSSGTSCGRVETGSNETLKISVGIPGVAVDRAEIDIDGKTSVDVRATFSLGGHALDPQPNVLLHTAGGSDSGPDCGPCDNYAFSISGFLFDQITLTPVATQQNGGSFSVQGGAGDPATGGLRATLGTRKSVFELVTFDGVLACGGHATESSGTTSSTVTLLNSTGCTPVPYSLDTAPNLVKFLKDLSGNSGAQFTMDVTWDPETAVNPPSTTHTTQITYTDDSGYHALLWCDNVTYTAGGAVQTATPPGLEFWCLVQHDETLRPGGQMVVRELIFGTGDPAVHRG